MFDILLNYLAALHALYYCYSACSTCDLWNCEHLGVPVMLTVFDVVAVVVTRRAVRLFKCTYIYIYVCVCVCGLV